MSIVIQAKSLIELKVIRQRLIKNKIMVAFWTISLQNTNPFTNEKKEKPSRHLQD